MTSYRDIDEEIFNNKEYDRPSAPLAANDHLNMTQTNELLNQEYNKIDLFLQQIYYSNKC